VEVYLVTMADREAPVPLQPASMIDDVPRRAIASASAGAVDQPKLVSTLPSPLKVVSGVPLLLRRTRAK
jgi:hypothetical protein